jgi:hypothetical protein
MDVLGDPDQVRVHYVKVTNGLDVPFTDRYDGVPVTIPAGKSENIPLDMAAHFFGYHYGIESQDMFHYLAKRWGWNRPEHVIQNQDTRKTLAEEYFAKLKIEPVLYKMVKVEPDDPKTPVPADREPPAPKGPRRIEASV